MKTLLAKLRDQQAARDGAVPMPLPPGAEYLWWMGAQAAVELLVDQHDLPIKALPILKEIASACDRIIEQHGERGLKL